MQHNEWQDFIPFYVANTLSADEIRRFEAHLATCENCQQEIDDWRSIASAVWRDADDAAQALPPLSPEVYNRLTYRKQAPISRYSTNPPSAQTASAPANVRHMPQPRRTNLPLTAVAGLVVAVIFGGLLIALALRQNQPSTTTEIALDATSNAIMTAQFAGSGIGGGGTINETTSPTRTPNTGIIPTLNNEADETGAPIFFTNTPRPTSIVPSETPLPLPTDMRSEQLPVNPPTFDPAVSSSMAMVDDAPTTTPLPPDIMPPGGGPYITVTPDVFAGGIALCEAFNPTSIPFEIYQNPDRNSELVGIILPDQVAPVSLTSTTGWYFVQLPDGTQGWLQSGFAYLRGNCVSSLPIATVVPTATRIVGTPQVNIEAPIADTVVVINAAFADLYRGPNFSSEVIAVAQRNQQFPVLGYQGTGSNRWVLVQQVDGSQAWIWSSIVVEYPADQVPTQQP